MVFLTKKQLVSKVLVDSREQKMAKKALSFFSGRHIIAEIKTLKDGDLVFLLQNQEKVYIERKSFSDYVSSYIKNNHIQDQAIRLSEYNYYACIVHGNIRDLQRVSALRRISQDSVDKMTANLMLFYKLPIFFVSDEKQYLKLALMIAETVADHHGKALESMSLSGGMKARPDIKILAAQDNIGFQKAKMLLDEFGSPEAVLNASREDLLKIKGVGNSMVANIKELKQVYENGVRNEQKKV